MGREGLVPTKQGIRATTRTLCGVLATSGVTLRVSRGTDVTSSSRTVLGKRPLIVRKRDHRFPAPLEAYPVGQFGPQHGLSPALAWVAQRLFTRALERHGCMPSWKRALVKAGIISAVLGGRVGSGAWGRRQRAARGGRALARHALDHLRQISPLGVRTRMMNRMSREEQIAFAVAEVERMRRQGAHSF